MDIAVKAGAVVFVKDLERMIAFYRAVAALAPTEQGDGYCVLENAGVELVLHAIAPHIAARVDVADPPAPRAEASVKLILAVADLAAARSQAALHGGRLRPAEHEWDWRGLQVCDGVDPEGNVIQLRAALATA